MSKFTHDLDYRKDFRTMRVIDLLLLNEQRSQSQVAADAGMSPQVLSDYLAGRRRFTQEHLAALGDTLGHDPASFLEPVALDAILGKSKAHEEPASTAAAGQPIQPAAPPPARHLRPLPTLSPVPALSWEDQIDTDMVEIPVIGRVAAGLPIDSEENWEETIMMPREIVRHYHVVFSLRIRGDSMEGVGLFEGDRAVVQQDEDPDLNQVVVATVRQEATCKGYVQFDDGTWLAAYPAEDTGQYPPIPVDKGVSIRGVVIGVYKGKPQLPKPVKSVRKKSK